MGDQGLFVCLFFDNLCQLWRMFLGLWRSLTFCIDAGREQTATTAGSYHITIVSFNKHFFKLYIFIMQCSSSIDIKTKCVGLTPFLSSCFCVSEKVLDLRCFPFFLLALRGDRRNLKTVDVCKQTPLRSWATRITPNIECYWQQKSLVNENLCLSCMFGLLHLYFFMSN